MYYRPAPTRQRQETMARCLYIAWLDKTYSQFSVPDNYELRIDAVGDLVPERFTVYGDPNRTELWLRTDLVKSAMVMDLGADRPDAAPAATLLG